MQFNRILEAASPLILMLKSLGFKKSERVDRTFGVGNYSWIDESGVRVNIKEDFVIIGRGSKTLYSGHLSDPERLRDIIGEIQRGRDFTII